MSGISGGIKFGTGFGLSITSTFILVAGLGASILANDFSLMARLALAVGSLALAGGSYALAAKGFDSDKVNFPVCFLTAIGSCIASAAAVFKAAEPTYNFLLSLG